MLSRALLISLFLIFPVSSASSSVNRFSANIAKSSSSSRSKRRALPSKIDTTMGSSALHSHWWESFLESRTGRKETVKAYTRLVTRYPSVLNDHTKKPKTMQTCGCCHSISKMEARAVCTTVSTANSYPLQKAFPVWNGQIQHWKSSINAQFTTCWYSATSSLRC